MSACMSAGARRLGGIFTPGLIACGSAIQASSASGVLGNVAAARVLRLPTWVRSGATLPAEGVPWIPWHITHALDRKTAWPRTRVESAGGAAEASWRSYHAA